MADLRLSLEEGFAQDHLVIMVDEATVLDEADVTTRMQTGLAETVDIQVADPDASSGSSEPASQRLVRVSLPERGIAGNLTVDAGATPYVRVNLVGNTIEITATDSPPFYA